MKQCHIFYCDLISILHSNPLFKRLRPETTLEMLYFLLFLCLTSLEIREVKEFWFSLLHGHEKSYLLPDMGNVLNNFIYIPKCFQRSLLKESKDANLKYIL